LLDGEAETITRKAIELAKAGDMSALRLCLDRIAPPRRDRPVSFDLPKINCAADAAQASAALVAAAASGDLTPSEAAELGKLVDSYVHALAASDFEVRLAQLESVRGIRCDEGWNFACRNWSAGAISCRQLLSA
jgi:hypothetical protein